MLSSLMRSWQMQIPQPGVHILKRPTTGFPKTIQSTGLINILELLGLLHFFYTTKDKIQPVHQCKALYRLHKSYRPVQRSFKLVPEQYHLQQNYQLLFHHSGRLALLQVFHDNSVLPIWIVPSTHDSTQPTAVLSLIAEVFPYILASWPGKQLLLLPIARSAISLFLQQNSIL